MNDIIFQISTLSLLCVFYIVYFAKSLTLKRRGIAVDLLGKGSKPKSARITEMFLKVVTFAGAVVQFGSVIFTELIWSLPMPTAARIPGIVLSAVGVMFFVMSVIIMKDNWRAGFDKNQNTNLVQSGIYKISRNPAFIGFDLLYIGCAVAFPNVVNIAAALFAVVLFHFQIIEEEKYCAECFGEEYTLYKSKTMRYIGIRK